MSLDAFSEPHGELERSPDPLAAIGGGVLLRREGGRGGEGKGDGKGEGKGRKGRTG